MIPSRKRAERREAFSKLTGYNPGMYDREDRIRQGRLRARRDAARAMRRKQRMQ